MNNGCGNSVPRQIVIKNAYCDDGSTDLCGLDMAQSMAVTDSIIACVNGEPARISMNTLRSMIPSNTVIAGSNITVEETLNTDGSKQYRVSGSAAGTTSVPNPIVVAGNTTIGVVPSIGVDGQITYAISYNGGSTGGTGFSCAQPDGALALGAAVVVCEGGVAKTKTLSKCDLGVPTFQLHDVGESERTADGKQDVGTFTVPKICDCDVILAKVTGSLTIDATA